VFACQQNDSDAFLSCAEIDLVFRLVYKQTAYFFGGQSQMALTDGTRMGPYEVTSQLGEGGMVSCFVLTTPSSNGTLL
jgi:hypothetical protein